jgi:hypothetical protein
MHSSTVVRPRWLMAALMTTACTQWQPQSVSPSDVVNSTHPARLRVTGRDSSITVVDAPTVSGDSLSGRVGGNPWAIARPEVAGVAVQTIHGSHSALLISGIAAVAAGTIAVMTDEGSGTGSLRGSAGVR